MTFCFITSLEILVGFVDAVRGTLLPGAETLCRFAAGLAGVHDGGREEVRGAVTGEKSGGRRLTMGKSTSMQWIEES